MEVSPGLAFPLVIAHIPECLPTRKSTTMLETNKKTASNNRITIPQSKQMFLQMLAGHEHSIKLTTSHNYLSAITAVLLRMNSNNKLYTPLNHSNTNRRLLLC